MAKHCLIDWWKEKKYLGIDPIRFEIEKAFSIAAEVWFIPDITIYTEYGIDIFVEIKHENPVNERKLWMVQAWCYLHRIRPLLIEIDAEWIMRQIEVPKRLYIRPLFNEGCRLAMDTGDFVIYYGQQWTDKEVRRPDNKVL